MSRFFIDRPIFAWVLGLVLMLLGGIEVFLLPVAQFPSIAAPQISITVTYPGASAQTVTDTVVRPILQQMSGLDGLEYVSSSAQSDGTMEIDLTFIQGTDPNIAQVQVQNKLSLAEANLPPQVTQQGIKVEKSGQELHAGHQLPIGRRQHVGRRHRRLRRIKDSGPAVPHSGCRRCDPLRF